MRGTISCLLWVAGLGEGSPVFGHRRLRIRLERSQESHCPKFPHQPFPATNIKDNRGVTSHLQGPPQSKGLNLQGPTSSHLSQKFATEQSPHPLGLHHQTLTGGAEDQCNTTKPACPPISSHPNSPKRRQVKQSTQLGELNWEGKATGYKNVTSS